MKAYIDIESSQFGTADAILPDGRIVQFKMPSTRGKSDAGQIEAYRNMIRHFAGGGLHDPFAPAPKGLEWVNVETSDVQGKPYCEVLVLPRDNWQLQPKRRYVR